MTAFVAYCVLAGLFILGAVVFAVRETARSQAALDELEADR